MEPAYCPSDIQKIPLQQNPVQQGLVSSHIQTIQKMNGVFVKQRMNMMEVVTGCEMESVFDIFQKDPTKEATQGKRIWRAVEESSCAQRNCVQQSCRAFNVKVMNMQKSPFDDAPVSLHMNRPCTCASLCFNRPFVTLNFVEDGRNIYLGKISDPYSLCHLEFVVHDKADRPIYQVKAPCLQGGVICRGCPCAPCEKVSLGVVDLRSGQPVPPISKLNPSCLKDFMQNSDNFSMEFPVNASWEDRSLLMAAIIFIDFMMFEEKGGR